MSTLCVIPNFECSRVPLRYRCTRDFVPFSWVPSEKKHPFCFKMSTLRTLFSVSGPADTFSLTKLSLLFLEALQLQSYLFPGLGVRAWFSKLHKWRPLGRYKFILPIKVCSADKSSIRRYKFVIPISFLWYKFVLPIKVCSADTDLLFSYKFFIPI